MCGVLEWQATGMSGVAQNYVTYPFSLLPKRWPPSFPRPNPGRGKSAPLRAAPAASEPRAPSRGCDGPVASGGPGIGSWSPHRDPPGDPYTNSSPRVGTVVGLRSREAPVCLVSQAERIWAQAALMQW
jgi:hypothetical protein